MAMRLLGCICLCVAILLPTFCPAYCAGVVSRPNPAVQVIHPLSLLELFYTESSREEAPEREAGTGTELVLGGVSSSRPVREPKRLPPLSLRAVRALIGNLRHLHASLPLAAHALRHGNGLAAHCRC
jgi:hypothetical protein